MAHGDIVERDVEAQARRVGGHPAHDEAEQLAPLDRDERLPDWVERLQVLGEALGVNPDVPGDAKPILDLAEVHANAVRLSLELAEPPGEKLAAAIRAGQRGEKTAGLGVQFAEARGEAVVLDVDRRVGGGVLLR